MIVNTQRRSCLRPNGPERSVFPERFSQPALYTSLTLKGWEDNTVAVVVAAVGKEETAVESTEVA